MATSCPSAAYARPSPVNGMIMPDGLPVPDPRDLIFGKLDPLEVIKGSVDRVQQGGPALLCDSLLEVR